MNDVVVARLEKRIAELSNEIKAKGVIMEQVGHINELQQKNFEMMSSLLERLASRVDDLAFRVEDLEEPVGKGKQ